MLLVSLDANRIAAGLLGLGESRCDGESAIGVSRTKRVGAMVENVHIPAGVKAVLILWSFCRHWASRCSSILVKDRRASGAGGKVSPGST